MTDPTRMGLRALVPSWARDLLRAAHVLFESVLDASDHVASTNRLAVESRGRRNPQDWLEARITLNYHRLEKSFTLPEPRRPFGLAAAGELVDLMRQARAFPGLEGSVAVNSASRALAARESWNAGGDISDEVAPPADYALDGSTRPELRNFYARHSIRDFAPIQVPPELVESAVAAAIRSPSVCNRQPWRVHVFTDAAQIRGILSLQNGNRGFGETVPSVAVITVRRGLFFGANERNQRWIEGGIFASTLVWALTACNVDSCMLNWSQTHSNTRRLRVAAGLPEDEDVVMIMAIGYRRNGARVARSARRDCSEVLRWASLPPDQPVEA